MSYTSRSVYEFISKQTSDPIVEWKTCVISGQEFAVFQSDLDFYNKISPTFAGQRFQVPTPTLCPEERQRRRLMFRNERKLYKRKCDATGESIISMYTPNTDYIVYDQKFWRSDKRDGVNYSQEFDSIKPLSEQFGNLMKSVPKISLSNDDMSENSTYVNQTTYQKNCYMTFDADNDEDVIYSSSIKFSKSCLDCLSTYYSENCYQTVNCTKCFDCEYCVECETSSGLTYCQRCISCHDCFGCVNLANKQYCIFNKQHSKEEYQQFMVSQRDNYIFSGAVGKNQILEKTNTFPQRAIYKIQDENSWSNNVAYSKNCQFCCNIGHGRDLKYCSCINNSQDCYDFDIRGLDCVGIYDSVTVGENSSFSARNIECWSNMSHVYYSHYCFACRDCFACVSLKNKQYCILNKQYTKEEYEIQVAKIIAHMGETGEWGEFFHPSLSPFGYNETVANEYFPMKRDEAATRGYKWQDNNYDPVVPEGAKVIDWKTITEEPNNNESILKSIFLCEISNRPYRIIKQELEFYKKHNLPLPRKHPDIRHQERMQKRPGRTLYLRNCDKCNKEMLSVYSPSPSLPLPSSGGKGPQDATQGIGVPTGHGGLGGTKVYCELCYQQEVYG